MKKHLNTTIIITLALLSSCSKSSKTDEEPVVKNIKIQPSSTTKSISYTRIEWTELIPDDDLKALENPPEYLEDIEDGSKEDLLENQLKNGHTQIEDRYQQALASEKVRPEFNGRNIRIPGFIVPLVFDDQQTITTFFLVPFFGACIHIPPPPPNQIIYAEYEPGIQLETLYDPFWIEGTLSTNLKENEMATAAYSIDVAKVEIYEEPDYKTNNNEERENDESIR